MRGEDATYVHELAHLFTWRFSSHTLREGLADYLALKVHPGARIGPNSGASAEEPIPRDILDYLGTTRPPPSWLVSDRARRSAYYMASRRFVTFLIDTGGMDLFLKLYDSAAPETEMQRLYGASRAELVRSARL
jgi:hypothetical protein